MDTDKQQIRNVVARWIEATKAGDIETVLSLMAEDVVFLQPGQQPMIGRAAYAKLAGSYSGVARPRFEIESDIQEIQILVNWAFMWSKLSVTMTMPGYPPVSRAGHTLSVFKREGGKWLLARDANMLSVVTN